MLEPRRLDLVAHVCGLYARPSEKSFDAARGDAAERTPGNEDKYAPP